MVYQIKEKLWSAGDNYSILDESGRPCFYLQGKVFSWGNKLTVFDHKQQQVAFISQKLSFLKPKYEIFLYGELFAELTQEHSWFKKKFFLDVPGPNDYTINGSFWEHEFVFERGGRAVATASKKNWSWSDSYGVEIEPAENQLAILCACVVIDLILEGE